MALGVIFGLSCSLMLKHSELGEFLFRSLVVAGRKKLTLLPSETGRYTEIESCLVFLIAYTSYFFSNALTMSGSFPSLPSLSPFPLPLTLSLSQHKGIVSLLFCGITLKHYAYHNMSHRTQRTSRYMFGMLAQLSENFIFIYLGLSLFTQTQLVYKPLFILVTAVRFSFSPPSPLSCARWQG